MRERPLSSVPKAALLLLVAALALQIGWHVSQPQQQAKAEQLTPPPSLSALRLTSFGEPIALAKLLMLYAQAFDNQAGISLSFRTLDYDHLQSWLQRILELDPRGQYPLFAAANLYAEVHDPLKQRSMLNFIYQQFLLDPNRRWPWMAHAAATAKHSLKDLPLARKYAQAIRLHATANDVPNWAKQMEIFILEDMNELESAKVLLGGLLESGKISDPHELRFLDKRLKDLLKKSTP